MRIFSVFLISAFFWTGMLAQKNAEDVIYLKNGSVIRGHLLNQTVDSVKIETCCRNIFIFPLSEVSKMGFEKTMGRRNRNQELAGGFYNYSTFGLLSGKSEVMDSPGLSLNTFFGYGFSYKTGLGMGVGYEVLHTEIIPLKLGLRYEFLYRENIPIALFSVGYSLPLDKEKEKDYMNYSYEGGFNAGIEFGICSYRTDKRAFTVTVGYQYQRLVEEVTYDYWYNQIETNTYDFNKMVIKIGFLFK